MNGVTLQGIEKTYRVDGREVRALDGIDATIERGDFVSVIGYSGSGKSTLLRILGGLEEPSGGRLDRTGLEGRTGMVFQEPRLVRSLTVEQNMALALKHTRDPRKRRQAVDSSLELVGLAEFRRAFPGQLSGGMAQRAALGRALCREPDLLLMDEPFGALDALTRKRLQSELVRIYRLTGMTVVFVTHDVTEAVSLGRRVFVMERGRIRDEVPVPFPYPRNQSSADFIVLRDRVLAQILSRDEGVSVAI